MFDEPPSAGVLPLSKAAQSSRARKGGGAIAALYTHFGERE